MTVASDTLTPKGRVRRCAVSGQSLPQARLVRFVRAPDGVVTPDLAARLPGRGMWIGADHSLVEKAIRRRIFLRAFKAPVTVPDTLCDQIFTALQQKCLSLIGLARRSRSLVIGGQNCLHALEREATEPACLVIAKDACPKTAASLKRSWTRRYASLPVVVTAFDKCDLGLALGRRNVAYGVMSQSALTKKFTTDVSRLEGFSPRRQLSMMRA